MSDAARYPETGRKKRLKWRFFDFNVISLTREDTRIQYQAERRLARSNKGVINTCRPCEIKLKRESKKRDRERENFPRETLFATLAHGCINNKASTFPCTYSTKCRATRSRL